MIRKTVDARGKTCPQPVIDTRKALEDLSLTEVEVLVDTEASAENVARMARSQGCAVSLEDSGLGELRVLLTREDAPATGSADDAAAVAGCSAGSKVAVFVAADSIGRGDDELGQALMKAFLATIKDVVPRPTSLLFMNSGVKLVAAGSGALQAIRDLEGLGVEVLACGTCLDFFGLEEKLGAGRVSNMFEIASRMVEADRLVRP
ncbi:MAG: sulfurtransferase-like selenium metabolism protein YedF [Deltaproteobacteria bacterium]|nr:sulfurtransferase-like selenium metabolism protein YedF [Deltaproteobacteria bacterium]